MSAQHARLFPVGLVALFAALFAGLLLAGHQQGVQHQLVTWKLVLAVVGGVVLPELLVFWRTMPARQVSAVESSPGQAPAEQEPLPSPGQPEPEVRIVYVDRTPRPQPHVVQRVNLLVEMHKMVQSVHVDSMEQSVINKMLHAKLAASLAARKDAQ